MREKLIELLEDIQRCGEDFTEYEIYGMRLPCTVSNEDIADHLIQNGVTIQKWIPVTERLPDVSSVKYPDEFEPSGFGEYEISDYVLCYTSSGELCVARMGKSNIGLWWDEESNTIQGSVTYWMPLPEPPKEVE